jgi:hypothetical protein
MVIAYPTIIPNERRWPKQLSPIMVGTTATVIAR